MRIAGWPSERKIPRSATPRTSFMAATISPALPSSTRRSGPTTLTVFSPLTPDMASSTLSEMTCEKLNTTPGKARARSRCMSSVSDALVTPGRHCELGSKGASSSMFWKPDTSVPSSGRPSCDITLWISGRLLFSNGQSPASSPGQPSTMARMWPT